MLLSISNRLVLLCTGSVIALVLAAAGEDVLFLTIAVLVLGLAFLIIFRESGGFVFSPGLIFLLFFTVFIYISGIKLFLLDGEGAFYGGGDRNYIFFTALVGGLLMFSIGSVLASCVFRFKPKKELGRFRELSWEDSNRSSGDTVTIIILGTVAISMTVLYIVSQGSIPLFEVIQAFGDMEIYKVAAQARAEFTRYGRDAGTYFYQGYFQQFYLVVLPFVTLYTAAKYLQYRKKSLKWLWIILGIACSFFLSMSLQRWPLMFFLTLNFILYTNYLCRIKTSHALVFGGIALILFALITFIRGIESFEVLLTFVQSRILDVQGNVFYSMFEVFPRHQPFLGGQGIMSDVVGILPGPQPGFTRWLFDVVFRVYGTGTAPTVFLGQAYADFGLPGVWIEAVAAGFVTQVAYVKFLRGKKSIIRLVAFSFIFMALGELAITNPVIILFQLGIVTVVLLVMTLDISRWIFEASGTVQRALMTRSRIAGGASDR